VKQFTHRLIVPTRGKGLYEFTDSLAGWQREQAVRTGLLTVFVQHTSASLTIQENADPDVVHDLSVFFERLAPEDNRLYRHTVEGPDDMPAHIRAALTATQLAIPVVEGAWPWVPGRAYICSSSARRRTGGTFSCTFWGNSGAAWHGRYRMPSFSHRKRILKPSCAKW
jgi:secondary thiamine-phosphate synthase enzyme